MSQAMSDTLLSNLKEGVVKNWLSVFVPEVIGFFWSVVLALVVYWVGQRIIHFVLNLVSRRMEKHSIDAGVRTFTRSLLKGGLYVALVLVILSLFGISSTSVAAAVATMGLTAGFSLQGSLSNFAGGVLILILKPFVVGDYIMEGNSQNEGTVTEITIFYTKLLKIDEKVVVIPNGALANGSVTNYTTHPTRVLDLVFPISYDDDIRTAKEVIRKLAEDESRRIPDTDIIVFVKELGESSVDIGVRFTVATSDYWQVRWDTLEAAKYALEAAGLTIPFNQVDVNLKQPET